MGLAEGAQPLLDQGRVGQHPAVQGGVIDLQAALPEQLLDVTIAERVAQVPRDGLQDQRCLEVPTLEVILGPALQLLDKGVQDHGPPPVRRRICRPQAQRGVNAKNFATRPRPLLYGLGYRTPYAFSARSLEQVPVTTVSLEHVYRQDERDFIKILSQIRLGEGIPEAVTLLNERCVGPHRTSAQPLLLTPTKAAAERYNQRGLKALSSDPVIFHAEIIGRLEINRDRLPVPEHLELKVGARVMAMKNDPEGRWYNGSLGTVRDIDESGVFVRFDRSGDEHLVSGAEWTKVRQEWNEESQTIENRQVGAYWQIPLIPAWAITIHKAQGLTLDDVRLDLGSGAFAPGQVYVALSRVRTLAGLSLVRPLRPTEVQADPMLLGFMEWAQRERGTVQDHKQWPPKNSA